MKAKWCLFFCLLSLLGLVKANPAADYRAGRYAEAIAGYEKAVKQSPVSADLWYNLGNAYFKSGSLGRSIVSYERALRLNPGDEDIQHNLAYARSKTTDRIKAVPKPAFVTWFSQLFSSAWFQQWLITGGALLWLGVISFILSQFIAERKVMLQSAGKIMLLISVCVTIVGFLHRRSLAVNASGVLISPNVYVKSAPDKRAQDLFILHEGVRFCLMDQVGDWIKIRLDDGKVGWMLKQHLEKI